MIPEKQIPTKAFVVEEPGAPFILQDVVLDEVRANEVLVEMKYTGLCHTVCARAHRHPSAGSTHNVDNIMLTQYINRT